MFEGLYTAVAGMTAQQQRIDALSNDVANVNTDGYKAVRLGFRDLLYQPDGPSGVRTGSGTAVTQLGEDFSQGALQQTGQPFDLAIEGDGFFQVRTATGQLALTRAGSFNVDANGQLVDPSGNQLVPPVRIPRNATAKPSISPTGVVSIGGRTVGRIALVTVSSPAGLNPAGGNLYTVTAQSGPTRPAAGARMQQGMLEGSNVDLADTMINLMDAQRSYALASKAITVQDQMLQIANGVKSGA